MGLTIGVDIGGTKLAAGVVDEAGNILERIHRPTPDGDADSVTAIFVDVVKEFRSRHQIDAIGIGVAAMIDATRSQVLFAANLGWIDVPLRATVETKTGLPTVIENDANAAAWGEFRFGAGRGVQHLAVVTVGTGLGCGVIVEGTIQHGFSGCASEVGHLRVVPGGLACGCGAHGCLEQYASGDALVREAQRLAETRKGDATRLLALGDGTTEGIDGSHVTAAAGLGDPVALAAFSYVGSWLGEGLASVTAVLDPACFVIGGGVSDAGDLLVGPTHDAYLDALPARRFRTPGTIRLAELANDAGLVGAGDLAHRRVDPV
ncbi:MAG TPA: ROK family glucokinase [Actinomycetes bacterium]|nr:ROK family glucokinase [Actinomycetes bacterium]